MNRSRFHKLNKNRQAGNIGGWILAILMFGGLLSIGSQVIPLYLDHNTMSTLIDKLAAEPGVGLRGDGELRAMMKQRFKMNNIRDFDIEEHVVIKRTPQGTEVVMDYEVRLPLFFNLDLIASFDKEAKLSD